MLLIWYNMNRRGPSNTLHFRGVFVRDLKCAIESVIVPDDIPEDTPLPYIDLPKRFTSVESWPAASNLHCWSCGLICDDYPRFIPEQPSPSVINDVVYLQCDPVGCFNTWNCVVRYILKEMPPHRHWDLLRAVCQFEALFSGVLKQKIMPAPHKNIMQEYSGSKGITAKQYMEKIEQLNTEYTASKYKIHDYTIGVGTTNITRH